LPLTSFDIGKLKIAAHVREELELAGLAFESIRCKSGDLHTRPGSARLLITLAGTTRHIELSREEVESCQSIVAGEVWYKIAHLISELGKAHSA
jgi:hypothetical protein